MLFLFDFFFPPLEHVCSDFTNIGHIVESLTFSVIYVYIPIIIIIEKTHMTPRNLMFIGEHTRPSIYWWP